MTPCLYLEENREGMKGVATLFFFSYKVTRNCLGCLELHGSSSFSSSFRISSILSLKLKHALVYPAPILSPCRYPFPGPVTREIGEQKIRAVTQQTTQHGRVH